MKVSIALCTYNGERYIDEQLTSIAAQTRLPDELVICDDLSTDRTVAILREFAQRAPFPVRVFVNKRNLGSSKNFERAIASCEGDIIALADQDDVWVSDKLAVIEDFFNVHPDTDVVFSDAEIVDEALRPLGYRLWDVIRFSSREQQEVESGQVMPVLMRHNVVTGATMAFRSGVRSIALPVPGAGVHDAWIALIAAATGRVCMLPRPLVLYRQHSLNQLGARKQSIIARMQRPCSHRLREAAGIVAQYEHAISHLRSSHVPGVSDELLREFANKAEHVRKRICAQTRLHGWIRMMLVEVARGHYHRYSSGWWSVGDDLLGCSRKPQTSIPGPVEP